MEQLRNYLNTLKPYQQMIFAENCETSIGYLRKAISVSQNLNPILCVQIEKNTQGKVTRQALRPHDWQRIWPELIG
ncbi:YdaS family helix-turn-helix protein [Vibrio hippocampi]|uniref:Cro/Cl family transcriptional regulator n=1 Tax=Vibrio hippocampi TaxID=654686 RepID=A0ABN8DFQ4_9VIBR|nr:YdaS family helix-turn-helix protein [Vibrio hippocampi]CAH0525129.1 hypothetical protein VHP8226_00795 [Vibrio hippocampi]